MELETKTRYTVAGLLVASVALGTVVAFSVIALLPRGRSKRLDKRIDRKLHKLEEQLGMAAA